MKRLIIVILLLGCSSAPQRELVLYRVSYPCACTEVQAKRVGAIRILDQGLEEYYKKESAILDLDLEDELFQIPTVYLQNFTVQETGEIDARKISTEKKVYEAKGSLNSEKLEVFLNTKKKDEVNGIKVYTNRGTGSRGLELIQEFSKRRRAERTEDRDRHYKDRIDMLKKIK